MAKQGLDYFSLDVTFDTSLEVVVAKLGDKSLSIIIRIWQHIYKHNGYYMDYNDDELYMVKRMCNNTTIKELENVINAMVNKNLFNKEMFKNNKILTSKRLQDNYKEATKRRKNANIPLTYCIHNVNILKQSKVNKSKVNKSILKEVVKNDKPKKRFVIPTVKEIKDYCKERKNNVNADKFFNSYESKGWMIGKNKMKNWKAAVRTWENNDFGNNNQKKFHSTNDAELESKYGSDKV